jgi:uncharacterized protein
MKKVFCFILMFWATLSMADFNAAIDNYYAKNYEQAYKEFSSLAEIGEKRAQFNLSVMYFKGEYVEKDINKAYAWSQLAGESQTLSDKEHNIIKIIAKKVTNQAAADFELQEMSKLYAESVLTKKLYPHIVKLKQTGSAQARPIRTVAPKMPKKAVAKGISGYVMVKFDIDPLGKVRNYYILESAPKKTFDRVTILALKKWQFEPAKDAEGNPVSQFDKMYKVLFGWSEKKKWSEHKPFLDLYKQASAGDTHSQYVLGQLANFDPELNQEVEINPVDWYLKAAVSGHSSAQYNLGKTLIHGRGCVADRAKGIEWLTRSSSNGNSDATGYLLVEALKNKTLESQQLAIQLSQDDSKLAPYVKAKLAWLLATSSHQSIRNPKRALEVRKQLNTRNFNDEVTLLEIEAASYAALGDFSKAIDVQEDALDEADDRDLYLADIEQRLQAYENKSLPF